MRLAKVPVGEAASAVPALKAEGAVDTYAMIRRSGGFKLVPLLPEGVPIAERLGFGVIEGDARSDDRTSPHERIRRSLADLPQDVVGGLPVKWEYVGDIVIIKLADAARPYLDRIGRAYAEALDRRTVCVDTGGVSGEYRRPEMEVIYGTETESTRIENGIRYMFDVTKVMFASGNVGERARMGNLDCTGETVVDMFAGIGYFTLPIAKHSNASKVIACEKNPDSYGFLVRNIEINGVGDIVTPVPGDNRDIPGKGFADRILMGYVQRTSEFLPKALEMVRDGGTIHYHDTFYVSEYRERIDSIFSEACGERRYRVTDVHEVKSFAPSVSHYVADVRIG